MQHSVKISSGTKLISGETADRRMVTAWVCGLGRVGDFTLWFDLVTYFVCLI